MLKHFLSRITRNLAFDRLDYITAKRRDVHMITLLSELDACLPDPHSDVEAAVDAKLAAGSVNRFLSQLDKMDCAVFLRRLADGRFLSGQVKRDDLGIFHQDTSS